jgi:hypothetical protein
VERHNISIADMEQEVFENWAEKTKPSGDAEFVQSQWESSDEFHEFCDDWAPLRSLEDL